MKKILSVNKAAVSTDVALLIARVGVAALMLTHGIPKLMKLFSEVPVQFPAVMGMSAELSLALAIFAEVFCSVLLLIGLATRLAVIPLAITMLVAGLLIHGADPFSVKESALHFLLGYIVLFFAGSGKYSLDYVLQPKRSVGEINLVKTADNTSPGYQ